MLIETSMRVDGIIVKFAASIRNGTVREDVTSFIFEMTSAMMTSVAAFRF